VERPEAAKPAFDRNGLASRKGPTRELLVYAYRFTTNFVFPGDGLFQPELIEKYNNRASWAILVLIYSACVSVGDTARFTLSTHRAAGIPRRVVSFRLIEQGGAQSPMRKQTVTDVTGMRRTRDHILHHLFFRLPCVLLGVRQGS